MKERQPKIDWTERGIAVVGFLAGLSLLRADIVLGTGVALGSLWLWHNSRGQ